MAHDKPQKSKSLLAVFTGNGKGKTTASLGLAFRALGHGQKVCIIQFLKGNWKYGELESARKFAPLLDFHVMGRGFTWKSENLDRDREVALEAWEFAKKVIQEGKYSLVILDELTYLPHYKILDEDDILSVLAVKPEGQHVVVTGRYASDELIALADLVTEMVELKHPFKSGVKAQKGIEF